MTTPFLIADAAEVAIMSPLAEAAFGSYDLQVPEGIDIEDIHNFEAPGNELGYVARLSPQRATGITRRFIRADVAVTAKDDTDPDVIPESNVDRVLSEAESRVESEFFLESDITKAGLGAWIPYVDFNVGDIVNVRIFDIWVKLPVTRIEPIISDGDVVDWRVHVGGQLLSDDQAREVENATIQKELIQDRRDLAGIDAKATKAVKDSSEANSKAGAALDAVNDADGVIQGHVKSAADYSRESHEHSEASQQHSADAKAYSDLSHIYSQQSQQISAQSVAHSALSIEYSEESHKHSQKSQEHSEASFAHSDAARAYSEAANGHSLQAKQYSERVQDLQPEIEQAASDAQTASEQSSQYSAESKSASEQSSVHSKAATDAAELSQYALRLAELARDAAETSRRDAETKRDEAEQARRAGFAAMTAASAAMAQAEQERAAAEEARRMAENERAAAEDQRRLAETARAAAESARDTAEQKRAAAEGERSLAETARSGAESARDQAEQKRADAESERALAEAARDTAEQKRAAAETEREKAEIARAQTVNAFQQTQAEIDDMQNDAITALESQAAEIAELQNRSLNMAMVDNAGSTHPDVTITQDYGSTSYLVTLDNLTLGTKIHADFYTRASSGALSYVKSEQYVSTSTTRGVSVSSGSQVVNLMWARPIAQQVPISLTSTGASPARITWTDVPGLSRTATGKVTNGQLTIRATWEAANRGSTYGIRVLVGTSEFKRFTTTTLGPLSFLGGGDSRYTVSVSNLKMNAGQTFKVQVYSSAGTALQRSVKSATATGSWIEHAS